MTSQAISLELQKRDVLGKAVKHLRRDGLIPAVIHDHGKPSVAVMAQQKELLSAYKHAGKNHPVNLKLGEQDYLAMIKDVDVEPKKQALRHVVFNAVNRDEKVTAEVPVRMRLDEGNESSPAERAGLVVIDNITIVEVEALPDKLPDALEFDGEKLIEVGDHATVADLMIPEGVTIETDPNTTLATVYEPSAIAAANEDAGGDAEEPAPAAEEGEEGAEAETGEPGAEPAAEGAATEKTEEPKE